MRIVLATGGTAGHLFPALNAAQQLKREGHEVFILGSFPQPQGIQRMQEYGLEFFDLKTQGINLNRPLRAGRAVAAILRAWVRSMRFLRKYRPSVVAGFGGYGAFPVVLAAVVLRYPTLIHEQNVLLGRANKLLARFVQRIAISFERAKIFFDSPKAVLTGCPCHLPRQDLDRRTVARRFHLYDNKTTLLVIGGSQGSHRLNQAFVQSLPILKRTLDLQVIHLCGKKDYEPLRDHYGCFGIPFALFDFLGEMDMAYTLADLVIARAGAATVSEIAVFEKRAVLIPYPYAGGHQRENALALLQGGLAKIIEESDLDAEKLAGTIGELLNIKLAAQDFQRRLEGVRFPDAAQRLSREIIGLGMQ